MVGHAVPPAWKGRERSVRIRRVATQRQARFQSTDYAAAPRSQRNPSIKVETIKAHYFPDFGARCMVLALSFYT